MNVAWKMAVFDFSHKRKSSPAHMFSKRWLPHELGGNSLLYSINDSPMQHTYMYCTVSSYIPTPLFTASASVTPNSQFHFVYACHNTLG